MKQILAILLLSLGAFAQTVTTYHGGTYARTGIAMTVTLTGATINSGDVLVVTVSGTQTYSLTNPLSSNIVNFAWPNGLGVGSSYTMVSSWKSSGGTVRASTSESVKYWATGSVTIDQYNNLRVSGTPYFPLTLWLDDYQFFNWYNNDQLNGWGWNDIVNSSYSAAEYASTMTTANNSNYGTVPAPVTDSPSGVVGPGGRNAGVITGSYPTTTYNSGVATGYTSNSTITNFTLMWYWTDEPDINLAPYNSSSACSLGSGSGCDQLTDVLNEVHANDTNYRPQVVDFYGYDPSLSVAGRGYAPPNVTTDVMSYDEYPYTSAYSQPNNLCTTAAGSNDYGACATTVANWAALMDYFRSAVFYDSMPMMPVIEAGGQYDGSTTRCWSWSGTVSTSGTAVTGSGFSTSWTGGTFSMNVNGTNYTVSSINSSTSITLSSSAGTQSNVPAAINHSCISPNGNQWAMEAYLGIIHGSRGYSLWTTWASPSSANTVSGVSASESGSTVTLTTGSNWPALYSGNNISVTGCSVAGYNNTNQYAWAVTGLSGNSLTYTSPITGLGNATGCTVNTTSAPPLSTVTAERNFLTMLGTIEPVISQPVTRTVSTNQTTACNPSSPSVGSLVHAMTRDQGGYTWVIAQRVTDDICDSAEANASALSTQFTVSGLTGTATVTVVGESRTVTATNGVFTDNFSPYAQHIYQLGSSNPSIPSAPSPLLRADLRGTQ